MSQSVPLFVTAPSADHQVINRFLLHFRDWSDLPTSDHAHVVAARNTYNLEESELKPTVSPVPSDTPNGWSGASLTDVEAFVRDAQAEDPQSSIFFLLDDQGVRDKTVIAAERRSYDETEELTDEYNKVRVPSDEAYTVWVNLDIGNVGWEDYCDEETGGDEDGWWVYGEDGGADIMTDEDREKRDEAIKKLEESGDA